VGIPAGSTFRLFRPILAPRTPHVDLDGAGDGPHVPCGNVCNLACMTDHEE
jgi:hypothetical protein